MRGTAPQQLIPHEVIDLLGVLIGHQAATDLGRGDGRQDRLGARPDVSAPDPVNFERGARAAPFSHGELRLAKGCRGARLGNDMRLFPRQPGNIGPLGGVQYPHFVVETRHQHPALVVFEARQQLGEGHDGILDIPAIAPAVQVTGGGSGFDLKIGEPAQAMGDDGLAE